MEIPKQLIGEFFLNMISSRLVLGIIYLPSVHLRHRRDSSSSTTSYHFWEAQELLIHSYVENFILGNVFYPVFQICCLQCTPVLTVFSDFPRYLWPLLAGNVNGPSYPPAR